MEKFQDHTAYSLKKAIEKGTVFEEKVAETFINCKNKMSMVASKQFKRHFCRTVDGVFVAAGRAKFGMTTKRYKFQDTAMRASIHDAAVGRIPTIDHLFEVFHHNRTWMAFPT